MPVQVGDGATTLAFNLGITIASGTPATLSFNSGPALGPTTLGANANFTIVPTGGTPPYSVSLVSGSSLPPGTALVPFTGTGQPAGSVSLIGSAIAPGVHSFTLQVLDSLGNLGVRTFTWTVGQFAVLSTALANGSVGVPYSQTLQTAGGAVTWTLASGSTPPAGLSLSSGGTISGTPTAAGTFSFSVVGTSGGVSITFTLSLTISNVAITTPAAQVLPSGVVGQPYTFTFVKSGGGTPTFTSNSLPPGLNLSSAGVLSGTPDSAGSFTVVITVNAGGTPLLARFLLAVTQPNPAILDIPLVRRCSPMRPSASCSRPG